MKKKILILCAAMLVMLGISISASAETYGDLYYQINDDNTAVTITGCSSSATEIVIPSEIDGLPVTSIREEAFERCYSLASITIPDSVTSIGDDAFAYCDSLESVYISDIAAWCNITFGSSAANPLYYANKLYLNDKRAVSVEIPEGVATIPAYAFACDSIKEITIPSSVTSIGRAAFYGCEGLENVYISDIAAWCNIEFYSTYISDYEKYISNPLYYAENLYLNNELVTDLVIPDGVTYINSYAFYDYEHLTSITIPDSVTGFGYETFYDCRNLKGVYISDIVAWCNCNSRSNPLFYAENLYLNNELVTDLVIPDDVTSIGSYVFYGCDSLTNVTIPDSVMSVGECAFLDCDGLMSITIPDSVTSIGDYAFDGCSSLTSVAIGDGVTSIGDKAFYSCRSLVSVTIGSGVTSFGENIFKRCDNLTKVYYNASKVTSDVFDIYHDDYNYYYNNISLIVLGNNVTTIDTSAFSDCKELRKILIPKSVTEIEKNAFANCSKLTTVEYGGSEEDWEEIYIGSGNENLENVKFIFNSSLSNPALSDLDYLTYTINENNTATITNCYTLATKINIPAEIDGAAVTTINSSAFANRKKLTSVTVPDSVTSIGSDAFENCTSLKRVTLSENITSVPYSAFYGCTNLTEIYIPKNVTSIENYAFYDCPALTDIYYSGSEEEWNAISKGYDNSGLSNATVHFNSTMPEVIEFIPLVSATAQKTDSVVSVSVENAYENSTAYVAYYNADGQLISVGSAALDSNGNADIATVDNAVSAKVFVWVGDMQPSTEVQTIEL